VVFIPHKTGLYRSGLKTQMIYYSTSPFRKWRDYTGPVWKLSSFYYSTPLFRKWRDYTDPVWKLSSFYYSTPLFRKWRDYTDPVWKPRWFTIQHPLSKNEGIILILFENPGPYRREKIAEVRHNRYITDPVWKPRWFYTDHVWVFWCFFFYKNLNFQTQSVYSYKTSKLKPDQYNSPLFPFVYEFYQAITIKSSPGILTFVSFCLRILSSHNPLIFYNGIFSNPLKVIPEYPVSSKVFSKFFIPEYPVSSGDFK